MSGIFFLTDGTVSVPLLSTLAGYSISEWKPKATGYKNEGEWADTPLGEGRRPVLANFANTIEEFTLAVNGQSQDGVITLLQDLRQLGDKARRYWMGTAQNEPVWIEARGNCETNTRYCLVYAAVMPEDDNPYQPPFASEPSAIEEIILSIEHGPWMDTSPVGQTCLNISGSLGWYFDYPIQQISTDLVTGAGFWNGQYMGDDGTVANGFRAAARLAVNVPRGARIVGAKLVGVAPNNFKLSTVSVRIKAEATDNAATAFANGLDVVSRVPGTNYVDWSPVPVFVLNNTYVSPDISAVIQEVVDRPGWQSGNYMNIIVDNNGSTINAYRHWAPWLLIEYESPDLMSTSGPVDVCNPEKRAVGNSFTRQGLTHFFYYDTPSYGVNLLFRTPPFNVGITSPEAGDAFYFGVETSVPNAAPFFNVVMGLGAVGTTLNGIPGQWEVYVGGVWTTYATITDRTAAFERYGDDLSVIIPPVANITPLTVNGVTGYWIRFLVTGGGYNIPNITVMPYIQTTNAVQVNSEDVPGDIPALLSLTLAGYASHTTVNPIDSVIFGVRSNDRGASFTSILNASSNSLPTDTVCYPSTAQTSEITTSLAPAGSYMRTTYGGAVTTLTQELRWLFYSSPSLNRNPAKEWAGKYRVFIRYYHNNAGTHRVQLKLTEILRTAGGFFNGPVLDETPVVTLPSCGVGDLPYIAELGTVELPYHPNRYYFGAALFFASSAAITINTYDLVLIPVDEYSGEYYLYTNDQVARILMSIRHDFSTYSAVPTQLEINPLDSPKSPLYANLQNLESDTNLAITPGVYSADGAMLTYWNQITSGPPVLSPNTGQRIYFLFKGIDGNSRIQSSPSMITGINALRWARYFSMRGSR